MQTAYNNLITFLDLILKSFKQLNSYHKESEQINDSINIPKLQYVDKMVIVENAKKIQDLLQLDIININNYFDGSYQEQSGHEQNKFQITIKRFVWRIMEILDLGEQTTIIKGIKQNIEGFLNQDPADRNYKTVLGQISHNVVQMHKHLIDDLEVTKYELHKMNSQSTIPDIQIGEENINDESFDELPKKKLPKLKNILRSRFSNLFTNNKILNFYQNNYLDLYQPMDLDKDHNENFILNNLVKKNQKNTLADDLFDRNIPIYKNIKDMYHELTQPRKQLIQLQEFPSIVAQENITLVDNLLPQIIKVQQKSSDSTPGKQIKPVNSFRQNNLSFQLEKIRKRAPYNQMNDNFLQPLNQSYDKQLINVEDQLRKKPLLSLIIDQTMILPSIHKMHDINTMYYQLRCRTSRMANQQYSNKTKKKNSNYMV